MDIILHAADFAAEAHRDQRRKNVLAAPYINHPIGVARILGDTGCINPNIIAAALLHDVVEDTDRTLADISREFGSRIARIVAEVTDDRSPGVTKYERKRRQIESGPTKSWEAKQVKAADKLHNLTDLIACPPPGWSVDYMHEYFAHAHAVLISMGYGQGGFGNNELEARLKKLFETAQIQTPEGPVYALPQDADERLAAVRRFLGGADVPTPPAIIYSEGAEMH